jgi:hypothetical protein
VALALTAHGAEIKDANGVKGRKARATTSSSVNTGASVKSSTRVQSHRSGASAGLKQHSYVTSKTGSSSVVNRNAVRSNRVHTNHESNLARNNNVRVQKSNVVVNRDNNVRVNRNRNVTINKEGNVRTNRDRNLTINRQRNIVVTNNWRSSRFSGQNYSAFRNYHRSWHNRSWWSSHYNNIVFVNGGWYYWNTGYWYPAWGYDSAAYYPYDGPIYGYNNLGPDRVTVEVQQQLARDGYYDGPIDGALGPMTRRAIAAFQADHGLAVTAAIDEPTMQTLGV